MRIERWLRVATSCLLAALAVGCASTSTPRSAAAGTLLVVGGGLDNDTRAVWERFVELASARGPARFVVATAATGDEEDEVVDKTEALRVWAPGAVPGGSCSNH